ncbi:MAG: PAS domain-containing protein [Parvularculaceae bacterium]
MIAELQTAISNTPRRRHVDPKLTPADIVRIKAERMALLLRSAPVSIGVAVINAAITVGIAWGSVEHPQLAAWAGLVFALAAVRLFMWWRYSRMQAAAHGLANYARFHVAAMAVDGALWGALAPIFAVHGLLGNAFLPFMIAAMTATAIASAGASWRAVIAFNIPALAPFAVTYAIAAGAYGPVIALIVFLYAIATAYLAWTTQQMVMRSIRLRSRNDRLLDALRKQVDAAHETEKRYRALVESSQDITLIFSPEGRVVYASPAVNVALGAPPKLIVGRTTKELVHPDDLALFRSVGEKSLSNIGEVIPLPHVCMKRADGDYVALGGRLTNMLYVPGVEGFVFNGGCLDPCENHQLHAVAS